MPTELVTVEGLAASEDETLRANVKAFPLCYAFANNALSLVSTGVTGYTASRKAFGAYLSQINVNLCLGLLSALRQHKVQTYSNLRHALEHIALASYALHQTDDAIYFDTEPETQVDHEKLLKKVVYPWLKKAFGKESAEIKELKDTINRDHAHASLLHAYRTMEGVEGDQLTVKVNYIDMTDSASIATDLVHVGHVGYLGFMTLVAVNRDLKVIRGKPGIEEDAEQVRECGKAALRELAHFERLREPVGSTGT